MDIAHELVGKFHKENYNLCHFNILPINTLIIKPTEIKGILNTLFEAEMKEEGIN